MERFNLIKEFINIVFKLYLYADLTKKIHYTTEKSNTHKLCDEVRDAITSFSDDVAEQFFGVFGKPTLDLFPRLNQLSINEDLDLSGICDKMITTAIALKKVFDVDERLVGTQSLIDDFCGEMSKFKFLSTFDELNYN